ncbi:hypothetical protein GACE_2292 [Geoglobus acetivorans]|uniref:Uncharacterized protein n=1 Tax=Geoglobus acetivorans TaxID=565033 RepID=A0A0A7GFR2_GEOAI|nr:hypothetical protein GACE_2292 [Geoglobus acetivorans]
MDALLHRRNVNVFRCESANIVAANTVWATVRALVHLVNEFTNSRRALRGSTVTGLTETVRVSICYQTAVVEPLRARTVNRLSGVIYIYERRLFRKLVTILCGNVALGTPVSAEVFCSVQVGHSAKGAGSVNSVNVRTATGVAEEARGIVIAFCPVAAPVLSLPRCVSMLEGFVADVWRIHSVRSSSRCVRPSCSIRICMTVRTLHSVRLARGVGLKV